MELGEDGIVNLVQGGVEDGGEWSEWLEEFVSEEHGRGVVLEGEA